MGARENLDQPLDDAAAERGDQDQDQRGDVSDVDKDPGDHLNRPDQPDFDPAEQRPFKDPDADVSLPTAESPEER